MLIHFQRKGTDVTLDMPTALDRFYTFTLAFGAQTGDCLVALAADDFNQRLYRAMKTAREKAYAQGWAESLLLWLEERR